VFAFSGLCAALSGALLSYSLASASPAGLSDVIAPAAAGAILGGVSLGGGSGRPLGIAAGALTLAVLRSGLNAVGAPPFVNDITMGAVLLTVAILDGPYLARRLIVARRLVRRALVSRFRSSHHLAAPSLRTSESKDTSNLLI
jgi:ribose transport system permease protein